MIFEDGKGHRYEPNKWGGISQVGATPIKYPTTYADKYNGEEYRRKSERLNQIRLSLVGKAGMVSTVLDFGFGNGAFLDYARDKGFNAYGYDVPENQLRLHGMGWQRLDNYTKPVSVVSFFDSLEHTADPLAVLLAINAKAVVVSVPNAPVHDKEKFLRWYHRRPNEHLHHFNLDALRLLLSEAGFEVVYSGFDEDEVRINTACPYQNILSVVAKKNC